jgi:hypothetical protein
MRSYLSLIPGVASILSAIPHVLAILGGHGKEAEDSVSKSEDGPLSSGTGITKETRKFHLPRNPIPLETLNEAFSELGVEQKGSAIPDHEIEACIDCTYEFLEDDLLPKISSNEPITAEETIQLALARKNDFSQRHQNDLPAEFGLLFSAEVELFKLKTYYESKYRAHHGEWSDTAELVSKASITMRQLFEENLDEMIDI